MTQIYVSIGNSDDKLTQALWSSYVDTADVTVREWCSQLLGFWLSPSADRYQNACWSGEIDEGKLEDLRIDLRRLARVYDQESIVLSVASTEFLEPASACTSGRLRDGMA